jgi:VWFA-related protein
MRAALLAAVLSGATLFAAQDPQIFRSRIDLVQVEVVVTDAQGRTVHGLTKDDFTLLDRRKPQTIAVFDELRHTAPDAPILFPAELKIDVADNRFGPSERLVVMVIDDWNIWRDRADAVKELARGIVEQLSPRASMALLYTSRTGNTEVTQDRAELLAAVDRMKGRKMFRRPGAGCGGPCGIGMVMMIAAERTLEDAARIIRANDGRRKAFVFVSEQPPAGAGGLSREQLDDADEDTVIQFKLRRLMQALHETNVAVYALDPRGEITNQELGAECFPPPAPSRNPGADLNFDSCTGDAFGQLPEDSWIRRAQRSLETFAETTGGFGIVNTDDFSGGIDRIVDALDNYYLLGFYPTDTKGSAFRPVKVTVNRPGLTVRYRRGYMPPPKPKKPKRTDPVGELLAGVLPRNDVAMRLFATALPTTKNDARVLVWTEVSVPVEKLADATRSFHEEVQHMVVAGDMNVGKVKKQSRRVVTVDARSSRLEAGEPFVYQIASELQLPRGRYQIRTSVLSATLKQGGSVYQTLDVPDFRGSDIALSPIVLGLANGREIPADSRLPGIPFQPTLAREFEPSAVLRVYAESAHERKFASSVQTVQIVDVHGTVAASNEPQTERADERRTRISAEVPLANLAPGPYRLRMIIESGDAKAIREVGIVIRERQPPGNAARAAAENAFEPGRNRR